MRVPCTFRPHLSPQLHETAGSHRDSRTIRFEFSWHGWILWALPCISFTIYRSSWFNLRISFEWTSNKIDWPFLPLDTPFPPSIAVSIPWVFVILQVSLEYPFTRQFFRFSHTKIGYFHIFILFITCRNVHRDRLAAKILVLKNCKKFSNARKDLFEVRNW